MPLDADYFETYGKLYGKPDIERLGVFVEMPFMNGKGYVTPFPKNYPPKGYNIIAQGTKSKCGTQQGYFDEEFLRLFEGEGIARPVYPPRKKPGKATKDPFLPAGNPKWHSTPGDTYGCFSGVVEAMSNERRPKPKLVKIKPNFLTNPVKKGGPGVANTCLSKFPEHMPDPYRAKIVLKKKDLMKMPKMMGRAMVTVHFPQPYFYKNPYFDPKGKIGPTYVRPKDVYFPTFGTFIPTGPGKWAGGCHAGCFEPFPAWKSERIIPKTKKSKKKPQPTSYFYVHSMGIKTMQTRSILAENTDFRMTTMNYKTYEPTYVKHLL